MTQDVEQFLHELQTEIRAKFPDIGLLLYAVVDDDVMERRNIICFTNMDDDEVEEVVGQVSDNDFETTGAQPRRLM